MTDSTPEAAAKDTAASRRTAAGSRLALIAAVIIVAVVIALLFPMPFHGRTASAIGDLVHAPLFGSLALGCLWAWQRVRPMADNREQPARGQGGRLLTRCLTVWVLLSVFGVLMEILQSEMGRNMSRHDAIANAMGIAAAICGYVAFWFLTRRRRTAALIFGLTAVGILATAWVRPVRMLVDAVQLWRQFPTIASFESSAEMTRWYVYDCAVDRVQKDATDGEYALEVHCRPGRYCAVRLVEMVHNWSPFAALELDVALDEGHTLPTAELIVRVIEGEHQVAAGDGAAARFTLRRGERQRISLPLKDVSTISPLGRLDLSRVVFVELALVGLDSPTSVRFDRLTLVP